MVSNNSIIIPDAGNRLENRGIKAITLHPRTTNQKYKGQANWDLIKLLKHHNFKISSFILNIHEKVKSSKDLSVLYEDFLTET